MPQTPKPAQPKIRVPNIPFVIPDAPLLPMMAEPYDATRISKHVAGSNGL
jgi:hypothetical protein